MWFKNLQIYRLPAPWDMSAERLEEQLAKKPFHPCGSQDMESRGWLSPLGNEVLVHAVGGQFLICLGFEHRLLPSPWSSRRPMSAPRSWPSSRASSSAASS
jgi:DNA recombination-dependent growth factor C